MSASLNAIARWLVLLCVVTSAGADEAAPVAIAIVGATAIHPEREAARSISPNTTIVIAGNRILSVGPADSLSIPAGAQVIDAHGKWVIPGLIDAHVHFFQSGNLYARPDIADFTRWVPFAQETARNKARLPATFKTWLASGRHERGRHRRARYGISRCERRPAAPAPRPVSSRRALSVDDRSRISWIWAMRRS
jgi:hypothetical protein